MKQILICPYKSILHEISGSTAYYVLCSDYPIQLAPSPNALNIVFADSENPQHLHSFNPNIAQQIRAFFEIIPDGTDVFICCEYGVSRSPAIAAALMLMQGDSDQIVWSDPEYHPNTLVYKICCREFGVSLSEEELQARIAQNKTAFHERCYSG